MEFRSYFRYWNYDLQCEIEELKMAGIFFKITANALPIETSNLNFVSSCLFPWTYKMTWYIISQFHDYYRAARRKFDKSDLWMNL